VGDLSGFNWSQVPSVLVEMGLMSNSAEDRKLATASYQEELANGMANGIVKYLKSK
jgi:N-acetylmuramoyl-L-alanine amidase